MSESWWPTLPPRKVSTDSASLPRISSMRSSTALLFDGSIQASRIGSGASSIVVTPTAQGPRPTAFGDRSARGCRPPSDPRSRRTGRMSCSPCPTSSRTCRVVFEIHRRDPFPLVWMPLLHEEDPYWPFDDYPPSASIDRRPRGRDGARGRPTRRRLWRRRLIESMSSRLASSSPSTPRRRRGSSNGAVPRSNRLRRRASTASPEPWRPSGVPFPMPAL